MQGRWEINGRSTIDGEPINRDHVIGHIMSTDMSEEGAERVVEDLERQFAEHPNVVHIGPVGIAIVPGRERGGSLTEINERVNRFMWD